MHPSDDSSSLFDRFAGPGLVRGPVVGPFEGVAVEVWCSGGEPAVAVPVGDEATDHDLGVLRRVSWSLGCPIALAVVHGKTALIRTAAPAAGSFLRSAIGTGRVNPVPVPVPGIVAALVRLAGAWRERLLRQCLAGHRDWTEASLNLAVEAPIAGVLLGEAGTGTARRMRDELGAAGVVIGAVPPGLAALAWDLHLARGVRLVGADASIVTRPPVDRMGADRAALRRFAAWAGTQVPESKRVLVPACGAGRLLLLCGERAAAHNIHLYALDPDQRAVLFARAVVAREFGRRFRCTVEAAHPLVATDLFGDPCARLVPADALARLRPVDWARVFGGVDRFDRVLIGDPAVPLTRRTVVRRYAEGTYATAGPETDPALLLVEAGTRRLEDGGRVLALYPEAMYRTRSAAPFRRWLAPRLDVLARVDGYCTVCAAAVPLDVPFRTGTIGDQPPVLHALPRSALDPHAWTVTDPRRAVLITRLTTGATPLGEILLGGVRPAGRPALDPALVVDAAARRRLVRADRRAGRLLRPLIAPNEVTRFATIHAASRFYLASPLPPRARRRARELGIGDPTTSLPPPAGPRLLFAEGIPGPAFLWDERGAAIPLDGVGTIEPADPFLVGLLHSAPMAVLVGERCPDGLSARCLARLPVRLPDPYDEAERCVAAEIATSAGERLSLEGVGGSQAEAWRRELEAEIDRGVDRLYSMPSP